MINRLVISFLGLLLVSGCSTYSLEELRRTTPKGNAFQTALAKLYMDFSDLEEKDYDWRDSWYFADKGLLAVYGKETAPEDLHEWDLPKDKLAHLEKARADLLAALTPENIKNKPEIAARAQFNFDCWVEQQEENWQKDDIEACRDGFVRALAKLDVNEKKTSNKKELKKAGKKTSDVSSEKLAPTTTSFVVFFESGKDSFASVSDSTMAEIIKIVRSNKGYEVVIIDKAAGKKDNIELSLERIQAVKMRLIEEGVKEAAIKINGGVGKQINNRVEIFLNE